MFQRFTPDYVLVYDEATFRLEFYACGDFPALYETEIKSILVYYIDDKYFYCSIVFMKSYRVKKYRKRDFVAKRFSRQQCHTVRNSYKFSLQLDGGCIIDERQLITSIDNNIVYTH